MILVHRLGIVDGMNAITIIGWREWVGLPELAVSRIKAKIDTGAKTSALHADAISTTEVDGKTWAEFLVHPFPRKRTPEIVCRAPVVDLRDIRSSNGEVEQRVMVRTALALGPHVFPIDLTLTNRDEMRFRMLLGREALKHRFLVNSGVSFALGK
ncbi:MAG: RimK/LysX family protein [Pseudomonadota bacterium]